MTVRIRFKIKGKKHQRSFQIIAVDSRKRRDTGNFLEVLGYHVPHKKEVKLLWDKIQKWLNNGAQMSESVKRLVKANPQQ